MSNVEEGEWEILPLGREFEQMQDLKGNMQRVHRRQPRCLMPTRFANVVGTGSISLPLTPSWSSQTISANTSSPLVCAAQASSHLSGSPDIRGGNSLSAPLINPQTRSAGCFSAVVVNVAVISSSLDRLDQSWSLEFCFGQSKRSSGSTQECTCLSVALSALSARCIFRETLSLF